MHYKVSDVVLDAKETVKNKIKCVLPSEATL